MDVIPTKLDAARDLREAKKFSAKSSKDLVVERVVRDLITSFAGKYLC